MQCPLCNWQNPASYTHCFSCQAPLAVAGGQASASAPDKPRQNQSNVQLVEVFPGTMARLGATLIDGVTMVAIPMALVLAWVFARTTFDSAPGSTYPVALALSTLGLCIPALMDALGQGSVGKQLLGLRVATRTGERPGLMRSVLRHFLKYSLTLALTLAVPFLLHRLLTALFGERGLHSSMTGTFVVSRRASDTAIQKAVALVRGPGWFLKGLVMLAGVAAFSFAAMVAVVLWNQGDEPANPRPETVRQLDGAARTVLRLVENHYQSTGAFPTNAAAVDLGRPGQLPAGFQAMAIDPANGVVRLTIADSTGDTTLAGKHLVYTPVLRTRKQQTDIHKWQCGSDDIARSDRSFNCRHEAIGIAR